MKKYSRGISLTEVLTSVAIGAIVLGMVGILYGKLSQMRLETELLGEVEHVVHLVQDQLNNPAICGQALRDQRGQLIVWPDYSTPIDSIAAFNSIQVSPPASATNYNAAAPSLTIASYGQSIATGNHAVSGANGSERLSIANMILRQPDINRHETGVMRTTKLIPFVNGAGVSGFKTVDVLAAKIEFIFQANPSIISANGGLLAPRIVDLTLELDQATHKLVGCFSSGTPTSQSLQCAMNSTPCPFPSPGCTQTQYVTSIDMNGQPTCACAITCATPPIGPPGIYVPPAKGASAEGPDGGADESENGSEN